MAAETELLDKIANLESDFRNNDANRRLRTEALIEIYEQ